MRFFMAGRVQNYKIFGIVAVQHAGREVHGVQLKRLASLSTFKTFVVSLFAQSLFQGLHLRFVSKAPTGSLTVSGPLHEESIVSPLEANIQE